MTEEQLEKGKELLKKIESLKKHISFLQKAKEIDDEACTTGAEISSELEIGIKFKYWDEQDKAWSLEFYLLEDSLKTMMVNTILAKHQTDLSISQTEFNDL